MGTDANTDLYYHLDGTLASTGKKADSSGNGNNLTENGTLTASTGQIAPTANGAYFANTAATGNNLNSGSAYALNTAHFTIEFWINSTIIPANTSQDVFLIPAHTGAWTGPFGNFVRDEITDIAWGFVDSAGTLHQGNTTTFASIHDGNWHYVAVVWDGTTVTAYVDGSAKTGTMALASLKAAPNPINLMGFAPTGGEYYEGNLDEVRISNIARSSSAISTYWSTCPAIVKVPSVITWGNW